MIDFIIYEDEERMRNIYKEVINKFFGNNNQSYRIIELSCYQDYKKNKIDELESNKIFLLDIDVPGKTGLELAREIRASKDWQSQLIVITANEDLKEESLTGKMLMLDFISKCSDVKARLMGAIIVAYNILTVNKSIQFKQKGEIYQVKRESILYIEKNLNDNYITIVTRNDKLTFKCSINHAADYLEGDPRFMKTHRSCIVNLLNVEKYDYVSNIIRFNNKASIDYVSREKKKELKERLLNYQLTI